jgi:hypothetical protein
MQVLQELQKKNQQLPNEYHGTHMNEECQQLFVAHMREFEGMQNVNDYYGTYVRVLQ